MKNELKIFISQVMRDKTEQEIIQEREAVKIAIDRWLRAYRQPYSIIDSFLTGAEHVDPLLCLGHSIMMLSKADMAIFIGDYNSARGCRIEYNCCIDYNVPAWEAIKDKNGFYHLRPIDRKA